ncbi:unnamed protein product, partial [Hapterophycus canaliculatus]
SGKGRLASGRTHPETDPTAAGPARRVVYKFRSANDDHRGVAPVNASPLAQRRIPPHHGPVKHRGRSPLDLNTAPLHAGRVVVHRAPPEHHRAAVPIRVDPAPGYP